MNRNTLILILVIVVLALLWFVTMFIPKPLETTPVPETATNTEAQVPQNINTMCYLKHIDAAAGSDDTYLEISFKEGGKQGGAVTGKFNMLPAEKDKMTGTFAGTVTTSTTTYGIITVDYAYAAEGTNQTEKKVFRLREGEADVSFDLGKTFTVTLPQITCGTASSSVTL